MTSVTGIFDSSIAADRAVSSLLDEGFSKDDISIIMSDKTRSTLFSSTDDEANRVAKSGVIGASLGGAFGAILAGLTAVGAIAVTGGSVLAAGPVVAAFAGAGVGGTVGGLSAALVSAGFAADDANRYEDEIKAGKAVVIVQAADDKKAAIARSALSTSGAAIAA